MAVFDIRGTHGSGKTWIIETLLGALPHKQIPGQATYGKWRCKFLGYHIPALDLAILGPYITCNYGGCDSVKDPLEIVHRVKTFQEQYTHVMLEGILVAHTFARYNQLAVEMEDEGHEYHFMFLNTPLKSCIARARARRQRTAEAKGKNPKPFNPTNVTKDWHNIWEVVRLKLIEAGRNVVVLNYRDPMPTVLELLDANFNTQETVNNYIAKQQYARERSYTSQGK